MKVLVINSGSSSIKFQLLDMAGETVLASGLVERIGDEHGKIACTIYPGSKVEVHREIDQEISDHQSGMVKIVDLLCDAEKGVVRSRDDIAAVGHRVVHGGEDFREPVIIDDRVIDVIKKNIALAPLHNPANLDGIKVSRKLFSRAAQIGVFDTAFHQTIPEKAYHYALPYEFYEKHRVRRYGFHGTSHKFIAGECAKYLDKPLDECNLITVHLGNGCSITAIQNGASVDTSLGMTPLEGLVMGTRSGDLDPAIHAFLHRNAGLDIEALDRIFNKESGLKGMCGMNDMRDIHKAISNGDEKARLALEVQTYRVKKYIGAYMAVLGRVEAIVFTGGIGENDPEVRLRSVMGLECFGIEIDQQENDQRAKETILINKDSSGVKILVIPTNEELAIARECIKLLDTQP